MKKNIRYIYVLVYFPVPGNKIKIYIMKNEKKNFGAKLIWATAQLYCEKRGFCIAI